MAHRLSRQDREPFEDQLVDDALDSKFDAIGKRPDVAGIQWRHKPLHTACGTLQVFGTRSGYCVTRDDAALIPPRSGLKAIFSTARAAKAAGLIHLQDGFGDALPYRDGLRWDLPARRPAGPKELPPLSFQAEGLPDDHEWGRPKLKQLLAKFGDAVSAADENLEISLRAYSAAWKLRPPEWTKIGHGKFELKTPYGKLVIRRMVGWLVERDGAPRVWWQSSRVVIFDKLEYAKLSGLVHARDYAEHVFCPDGTQWAERVDEKPRAGDHDLAGRKVA